MAALLLLLLLLLQPLTAVPQLGVASRSRL
jgi:hypothetical protein